MDFQGQFFARLRTLKARNAREFPVDELPRNYRLCAVMLLIWPEPNGRINIAFTRRSEAMPSHKGQVSFPGGGMQQEDKSAEYTALRETWEELGIDPAAITVMGRLDDAWSRHGFRIVPYVGWLPERPDFNPDYNEVSSVIIADVETLMQPQSSCLHQFRIQGLERTAQAFKWEDGYVWGVTADILLELFLWVRGEESSRLDLRLEVMRSYLIMDSDGTQD